MNYSLRVSREISRVILVSVLVFINQNQSHVSISLRRMGTRRAFIRLLYIWSDSVIQLKHEWSMDDVTFILLGYSLRFYLRWRRLIKQALKQIISIWNHFQSYFSFSIFRAKVLFSSPGPSAMNKYWFVGIILAGGWPLTIGNTVYLLSG